MRSSDEDHLLACSGATQNGRGQSLAEYALILGLIAIVAVLSLIFLGDTIADLISLIGDTVD
jgi:Flp pilus assembly pilin Flp